MNDPSPTPPPPRRLRRGSLGAEDLSGADLARADFRGVRAREARLRDAVLAGATLQHVDLSGADLRGVDLRGATLVDVELVDARLDGADLRGARLKGVRLHGASAPGLRLSGAEIDGVEFDRADLRGASLDGSELQESSFDHTTLASTSLQGVLAVQCTLADSELVGCDLSGSTFETALLRACVVRECDLSGALFRRSRFQDTALGTADLEGCVLDQCLGTDPALEQRIEQGGAAVAVPWTVRAVRVVRADRRLQLAVAIVAALALLTGAIVALNPGWWPTTVLAARMDGLRGEAREGWCERYTPLGERLARRTMEDRPRQLSLLRSAAECLSTEERLDDAEALYRRRLELAEGDARLAATLDLGRFLANHDRWEAAAELAAEVRADARASTAVQLEALRLLADIQRGTGDERAAGDGWIALQRQIGEALLNVEGSNLDYYNETPALLYALGEYTLADRLLAEARPALTDDDARAIVVRALDELREVRDLDAALALLDHLDDHPRFGGERARALFRYRRADLLLDAGRLDEVAAIADGLDERGDAPARAAAALVRARAALAEGDGPGAMGWLDGASEVPPSLREPWIWTRVDAALMTGDEPAAMTALEPLLREVEDPEQGDRLLRRAEALARRMEDPGLLVTLLAGIDNPALADAGGSQAIVLEALRERAASGELPLDDPQLVRVVTSDDPWSAIQAFDLLLAQAGDDRAALLAAVGTWAGDADGDARLSYGMWLVDAHAGRAELDEALAVADELGLWAVRGEHRGRLHELAVRVAIREGDLEAAAAALAAARAEDPPLGAWAELAAAAPLLGAYENRGDWSALLDVARAGLARAERAAHRRPYHREIVHALLRLGRDDEADAALRMVADERGVCVALQLELEALDRAGRDRWDPAALRSACAGADVAADELLMVAETLAARGAPADALAVLESTSPRDPRDHQRRALRIARERYRAASGDPDGALRALDALVAERGDRETRLEVARLRIEIHGDRGDPDAVLAAYSALRDGDPDADLRGLWEDAARALIATGARSRIDELAGDPAWSGRIHGPLLESRVRAAVDAGRFDDARTALAEAAAATDDDDRLGTVLWLGQEVADRSGERDALLPLLATIADQLRPGSPLGPRVELRRAITLDELGRTADALERTRALTAGPLPVELQADALYVHARALGRAATAAEIGDALDALAGANYEPMQVAEATLVAAEGLLGRGEHDAARQLVERVAGIPLSAEVVRNRYYVIARAWVDSGRTSEALALPERFPGGAGVTACDLDSVLLQAVPWDTDEAAALRARVGEGCDPATLGLERALSLAGLLGDAEPARGVAMIEGYRAAHAPAAADAERLDIVEARARARMGDRQRAEAMLRRLIDGATDPWIAADAAHALILDVIGARPDADAAPAEAVADELLGRVTTDGAEARHVIRAMVGFHHARDRFAEAVEWQLRLVERMPSYDLERGHELLTLARLELQGAGLASPRWSGWLDQADAVAPAGSGLASELSRLRLGTALAVPDADPDALVDTVADAIATLPEHERRGFVLALADDLDWLLKRPRRAEAIRAAIADGAL